MQHPQLQESLAQLKTELQQVYGDRLKHLVLFGSQARGDAEGGSDVDVLVVLNGPIDFRAERKIILEIDCKLSLEYSTCLSCVLMDEADYLTGELSLLWSIEKEGVAV